MPLHRITGRAKKCGPTAMSAVLGIPSNDCAFEIRSITQKRAVNGTCPFVLAEALERLYEGTVTARCLLREVA